MIHQLPTLGLYCVQALLLGVLLVRGDRKRLASVCIYLFLFLLLDGLARYYTLFHYGFRSLAYFEVYCLTDVILTVAAFALICALVRRACASNKKVWHNLRPLLGLLFFLLVAGSYFMIASNHGLRYPEFVVRFQRNTYLACLVLTALLYIVVQRSGVRDEELAMLVFGMGILLAGPVAALALFKLFAQSDFVNVLINHVDQACMLGMLLTWWYAITRLPHGQYKNGSWG